MKVYTIGYEGLDIDAFLSLLNKHGIETVVDIRELPISRKPGFSKKLLANFLNLSGFEYEHIAALGCPRPIRDRYRQDSNWKNYTAGFLAYLATQQAAISTLAELVSTTNCALLCYEADFNFCHRMMVAMAVHQFNGAEIQHISAKEAGTKTAKVVPPLMAYV
jgi:uncharacterized protein (DUF488 family)